MSDYGYGSKEKQESHNQGEQDAAEGKPRKTSTGVFDLIGEYHLEDDDCSDAYDKGYDNAKKGACFLTTACVERAGLPDDCHQLTVLRTFRDNYIGTLPDGLPMLAEYYRLAPAIVQAVSQSSERDAVLAEVFASVNDAVELIEIGSYSQALSRYQSMFSDLKQRYEVA